MKEEQIKEIKKIGSDIEEYMNKYPNLFIRETGECSVLVAKLIGYIKCIN